MELQGFVFGPASAMRTASITIQPAAAVVGAFAAGTALAAAFAVPSAVAAEPAVASWGQVLVSVLRLQWILLTLPLISTSSPVWLGGTFTLVPTNTTLQGPFPHGLWLVLSFFWVSLTFFPCCTKTIMSLISCNRTTFVSSASELVPLSTILFCWSLSMCTNPVHICWVCLQLPSRLFWLPCFPLCPDRAPRSKPLSILSCHGSWSTKCPTVQWQKRLVRNRHYT